MKETLKEMVVRIIKEETSNELQKISIKKAKQLFASGICIYIKYDKGNPESGHNIFSLTNAVWDAGINIYSAGATPEEFGFDEIIKWIEKRVSYPLEYYTLNSNKHLSL